MTTSYDELDVLAATEPTVHPGSLDLAEVYRQGRRIRGRRRAKAGLAGLAAAGVIAAPVLALQSGDPGAEQRYAQDTRPTTAATDPSSPETANSTDEPYDWGRCVVTVCESTAPGAVPETARILGTPWTLPGQLDGRSVVLYGTREPGYDTATGEPKEVTLLKAGLQGPHGIASVNEPLRPADDGPGPIHWASFKTDDGYYALVGYIEGEWTSVSWTPADGEMQRVDSNRAVLPGYTVFYVTGDQPPQGIHDVFARGVISVPGGPSCSDCEVPAGGL